MCCFHPLFRWIQDKIDPDNDVLCMVVATEIIRWFTIAIPIYLAAWRYAEILGYTMFIEDIKMQYRLITTAIFKNKFTVVYFLSLHRYAEILGYTVFIPGMDIKMQYWLITTTIFVGASLVLYLPLKVICSLYWKDARYMYGWRPSIVTYIIMCALPCLVVMLYAIDQSQRNTDPTTVMDAATTASIQACVMGLTVTEWMAKMREEVLTYDLTNSMATDFFFLYDVIDFFMLCAFEPQIYHSPWLYVTFVFGFIAMLKYIPNQPTTMNENGTPKGAVTCILVSLFCSDIPFLVVRVTTMVQYGLRVSDIIHPAKNVAMISFGLTQLYIIYQNHKVAKEGLGEQKYHERRCARHSSMMSGSISGSMAGTLSRRHGEDRIDAECTCEDMEHAQSGSVKVQMRDKRGGSGKRVSPEPIEQRSTKFV